ncbi:MAG TPA: DUF4956 domain-containing protein [Vicinamibacterales bacterium]|nr:DUF4956 domain-containing protein [Vicinamibacterales bacterium]
MQILRAAILILLFALLQFTPSAATAQPEPPVATTTALQNDVKAHRERGDILSDTPDMPTQIEQLFHAFMRLPIAAGLATLLAVRPRRRGTPPRKPPVVQTQIILAVVGAVVMLVVGSSLARAFGIVGAAGLVRYRARIDDPKDAGVMLSTLAVGLAAGVGLWLLAIFGTVFIGVLLWIVESFEPKAMQTFLLKVKAKEPERLRPAIEQLLRKNRVESELRGATPEEISWDAKVPLERKTDRLSEQILDLDREHAAVQWEEKKEKK